MKIVLSVVLALFLVACSDSKDSKTQNVQKNQEKAVAKAPVAQKEVPAVQKEAPVAQKVVSKVAKKVETAVVKPVVEKTKEEVATVTKTVTVPKVDGAKIFVVCSSCHGSHAQNKALGKSQVIQGWKASKIEDALKGYKAGTYGGTMKAVMKGQASKLSDAQIQAVAAYISKL